MASINLLPRKEFEIITEDGTIVKGKFGTWAQKRMCDKLKIERWELSEKFLPTKQIVNADGSTSTINLPVDFNIYCEFFLCAIESVCRENGSSFSYTDVHVCKWLDEFGGFESEKVLPIYKHIGGNGQEEKKTEAA